MVNKEKKERRHAKIRKKVKGSGERPRLSVFRSNRHMVLQLIDDEKRKTLLQMNDIDMGGGKKKINKTEKAFSLGKKLAEAAISTGVKKAVFDRGGYKYHGRVKAVADGARKAGLQF